MLLPTPSIISTRKNLTEGEPGENVAIKRIVHLSLWKPKRMALCQELNQRAKKGTLVHRLEKS